LATKQKNRFAIMAEDSVTPGWFERAVADTPEGAAVEVEGCPIHYLRWGDRSAPGLALVPPSGGHAHWFSHVAPLLADQFHVIAVDPSGCGDSGRRDLYSRALITAEIIAACTDAGLFNATVPPILVGHSAGAQSAVRAAIAHDRRLLGVIGVDGIRYAELEKDHAIKALRAPRPESSPPPRPPRVHEDLDRAAASFRLMPAPLQEIEARYVLDHIARHSFRRTEGGWVSKFDPAQGGTITLGLELLAQLKDLRCRAALIYGEHTHIADETATALIAEATGGRVPAFVIPSASHYPMIDSAPAFVTAIKGIGLTWRALHRS
jgi:pimeloyl-ACP methyl ester carboxylesterase